MVKRILIIEDDLDILEILDIIFLDEGYDIISHRKGLSADEIGLLHPDLLLLDVRISGSQIRSHIVLINRKQVHNRFAWIASCF